MSPVVGGPSLCSSLQELLTAVGGTVVGCGGGGGGRGGGAGGGGVFVCERGGNQT